MLSIHTHATFLTNGMVITSVASTIWSPTCLSISLHIKGDYSSVRTAPMDDERARTGFNEGYTDYCASLLTLYMSTAHCSYFP